MTEKPEESRLGFTIICELKFGSLWLRVGHTALNITVHHWVMMLTKTCESF